MKEATATAKVIGTRAVPPDGSDKITGRPIYSGDMRRPEMPRVKLLQDFPPLGLIERCTQALEALGIKSLNTNDMVAEKESHSNFSGIGMAIGTFSVNVIAISAHPKNVRRPISCNGLDNVIFTSNRNPSKRVKTSYWSSPKCDQATQHYSALPHRREKFDTLLEEDQVYDGIVDSVFIEKSFRSPGYRTFFEDTAPDIMREIPDKPWGYERIYVAARRITEERDVKSGAQMMYSFNGNAAAFVSSGWGNQDSQLVAGHEDDWKGLYADASYDTDSALDGDDHTPLVSYESDLMQNIIGGNQDYIFYIERRSTNNEQRLKTLQPSLA